MDALSENLKKKNHNQIFNTKTYIGVLAPREIARLFWKEVISEYMLVYYLSS